MVWDFQPGPTCLQLASFFFAITGISGDLLAIRSCLFAAYLMLFICAVNDSSLQEDPSTHKAHVSLDSLFWALIGMYVHGSSLINIILDEREVQLSEHVGALWRMFYRTGGLSARIFKTIISPHLEVIEVDPGQVIPTDECFYIIYHGKAALEVLEDSLHQGTRIIGSGDMFDLTYLGMFRDDSIFPATKIIVTSVDRMTLFRFRRNDMIDIAHDRFAKGVWQSLLINILSIIVESHMIESERRSIQLDGIDRIFSPLMDWELPEPDVPGSGEALRKPLQHWARSVFLSLSPPWPFKGHLTGVRQTLLPAPPQRPTPTSPILVYMGMTDKSKFEKRNNFDIESGRSETDSLLEDSSVQNSYQ